MGNNPSAFQNGDDYPVESVSWNDIVNIFLPELNRETGKNFCLPTEAQWEYAARGGNKSKGYKYSGSNNLADVAWYGYYYKYDENRTITEETTMPVAKKKPNELGIYDMSGNVWEWCQDWYGNYSSESQTDPQSSSSGSSRVLRGGSWYNYANDCRVSSRISNDPGIRYNYFGMRLALPCSPFPS
jgi:formylglycine-generating enzyme required for sulfatase activity